MSRKGKIQTVKGVIDPTELGMTMTHEHIFIEFPPTMAVPPDESHKKQVFFIMLFIIFFSSNM